jgi:hypothetical protein
LLLFVPCGCVVPSFAYCALQSYYFPHRYSRLFFFVILGLIPVLNGERILYL